MLYYLLQTVIFQVLFLVLYDVFHKKDTFFNWNRLYLLSTSILSFILPLIKIKSIQENIPEEYIIQLPAVFIGQQTGSENFFKTITKLYISNPIDGMNWWQLCYGIGVLFMLILFIRKIIVLKAIQNNATYNYIRGYKVHTIRNSKDAFSFFKTVYIGDQLNKFEKKQVITHEIVHLQEKHSIDLLWFELLKIVFWFNPLVYVYQLRINVIHEFIADAKSIKILGKKEYYEQLLNTVFATENIKFINQFFNYSLIKKRILMLQKSKSKKTLKLKYLLLLPIVCSILVYTSCTEDLSSQEPEKIIEKQADQKKPIELIKDLRDAIMVTGGLTDDEEEALKILLKKDEEGFSKYKNHLGALEIPFSIIDKVPTTKSCNGTIDNWQRKKCVSNEIKKFVNTNFNIKIAESNGLTGINRIYVRFKIDNTGKIVDVQARGPIPELEQEAKRVIQSFPQMIPGEHQGEKVGVLYSLPIVLMIE